MYRPAPVVPGLPLPRVRVGTFTALIFAASALGVLVTLAGFARGGPRAHLDALRDGGAGMFLLLLLAVALPIGLAFLGVAVVRGKRLPLALLFGVALAPTVLATLAVMWAGTRIDGALSGVGFESDVVPRIVAAGTGESMNLHALGDLASAVALAVVALAAGGAVATIDVGRVAKASPRARTATMASLALAVAWGLSSIAILVAFADRRSFAALSLLRPVLVVAAGALAVSMSRASGTLASWHDDGEARGHTSAVAIAGLAAIVALALLGRAVVSGAEVECFGAIAGDAVDREQQILILSVLAPIRRALDVERATDCVLGGGAFVAALAPALARGPDARMRSPRALDLGLALALAAVVGASALAEHADRSRRFARAAVTPPSTDGLSLPALDGRYDARPLATRSLVVRVPARGPATIDGERSIEADPDAASMVIADENAAFAEVLRAARSTGARHFELVVRRAGERPTEIPPALADLAPLVRPPLATVAFDLADGPRRKRAGGIEAVILDDRTMTVSIGVRTSIVSLDSPDVRANAAASRGEAGDDPMGEIVLVVRPGVRVASAAIALATLWEGRRSEHTPPGMGLAWGRAGGRIVVADERSP